MLKTPICCERFNKTVRACAGTLFVSSCELICLNLTKSSVISQKDQSQNGCFKKTKRTKFSEKRTLLAPWYANVRTCAYQGVGNVRFSENLACFVFLKHPFWERYYLWFSLSLVCCKLSNARKMKEKLNQKILRKESPFKFTKNSPILLILSIGFYFLKLQ